MQHLLKMSDLTDCEIIDILNLADQLKYEQKNYIEHSHLKGKTLGMIFNQPSTRTRVSFEVGMIQLGGHPLFLSASDLQIEYGETMEDTARVLSRYLDGIMIRTDRHEDVERLAEYGLIPVINGLTSYAHPCQVLADLMTIREKKRTLKGLKAAYSGPGHSTLNSFIVGGLKAGLSVAVASPGGYGPSRAVVEFAKSYGEKFSLCEKPEDAAKDADVILTDVWRSPRYKAGTQELAELMEKYQLNENLISYARPGAIVLHRLPARKGEEISEAVFESHAGEIFEEAENRLHVQKAVLLKLIGG
ncbi:MAG: ornithine carbamoyltransferase [Oscillospiraceae bacterium]|jgi:ornithine carbamoyltransferase|nr:ornithine carbamoyltransferase [Oscillospiraceae bacterium]